MDNLLPDDFNPESHTEIPYVNHRMFANHDPEMEKLARELIRSSLEKRLGKPVIPRDALASRFRLRNLGFTAADIIMDKVKIR